MAKIDNAIAIQAYILDVLMAYREISKLPTCNECKAQRDCPYVPKLGQTVRYNCFAFVGEVQDAKDINAPTKLDDFDRSGEEWR